MTPRRLIRATFGDRTQLFIEAPGNDGDFLRARIRMGGLYPNLNPLSSSNVLFAKTGTLGGPVLLGIIEWDPPADGSIVGLNELVRALDQPGGTLL